MTRTVEALKVSFPNLAKFADYLYQQVQSPNPTIKAEQRKEAELVLKDIRLLCERAGVLPPRQKAS